MKRFVVIVLDGFGIGAMDDVKQVRPQDAGAHTLYSVLDEVPNLQIPNLLRLGLMNAAVFEMKDFPFSQNEVF